MSWSRPPSVVQTRGDTGVEAVQGEGAGVADERAGSQTQRRGWLTVAGAVAAVFVGAVGVGAVAVWGVGRADEPSRAPSTAVRFDVDVRDDGVGITTEVAFPNEVTLSNATLQVGDSRDAAWLWPLDGRDHEGEDLDPLTVPGHTRVAVSATIRPSCDGDAIQTVRLAVTVSQRDGATQVHEYTAVNQLAMPPAVRTWCAKGPTVTAGMEHLEPDGDAVIGVYVINPGPDPITVEIPAYTDEHVSWAKATAVAPPGEKTRLEIHGMHVGCEPGEIASWANGRLLLDGQPYKVKMDDAWC